MPMSTFLPTSSDEAIVANNLAKPQSWSINTSGTKIKQKNGAKKEDDLLSTGPIVYKISHHLNWDSKLDVVVGIFVFGVAFVNAVLPTAIAISQDFSRYYISCSNALEYEEHYMQSWSFNSRRAVGNH